MEKSEKSFIIFSAVVVGVAVGVIENSVGLGFISGVSVFNIYIFMAITSENL